MTSVKFDLLDYETCSCGNEFRSQSSSTEVIKRICDDCIQEDVEVFQEDDHTFVCIYPGDNAEYVDE